jgi:alpha-beta hydrolase superfamily lysophospholipase
MVCQATLSDLFTNFCLPRQCFIVIAIVLIHSLSACSPLVQSSNNQNQAPQLTQTQFITSDGSRLPVKKWLPDEHPRVVLVALHGFNDYSNGFAWPAEFLAANGIATIAYDQRGFGQAPHRGIWPGTELLIRDVSEMVQLVKSEYPQVPVYLMGVSMGGAVALSAAASTDLPSVEGLFLVNPAVWGGESLSSFYRSMSWLGAHVIRGLKVSRVSSITFSDNEEMLDALHADSNYIAKTRLDAAYGITNLMDHVQEIAVDNKKPAYIFYGLKDEVISVDAMCLLLGKLSSPFDVTFYSEGYHLLLRDLNRRQVWLDILDKLTKKHKMPSRIPDQCRELSD